MSKSVSRKMGVLVAAGMGVIVFAVVGAGCQQSSPDPSATGQPAAARSAAGAFPDGAGPATTSTPTTPAGDAATAAAAGAAGNPQPTPAGAVSGGPAATKATAAHATTPSTAAHPTTTAAPGGATGPAPATPGTYHYHQVASLPGTPAEGTLVVAGGSAAGTQTWTRYVGGSLAPAVTSMLFNANGSFLLSPSDPVSGTASCTFAKPVPWPPYPTTPGRSDSASATCTAPITSYQVTSQVQGTTEVQLGGASMTAAVVVNTFVIKGNYNGGAINVTLTETDEYAPNVAVPVVTTTRMSGTALGLSVSTQRTDTLESTSPS